MEERNTSSSQLGADQALGSPRGDWLIQTDQIDVTDLYESSTLSNASLSARRPCMVPGRPPNRTHKAAPSNIGTKKAATTYSKNTSTFQHWLHF